MKIIAISASLIGLSLSLTVHSVMAASDYPVAGTTPWQRPDGAPAIEWVQQRDRAWYQKGLTGINLPYPHSLYFMDNQGNWYTPFTRPGMTGPYDLRGWHQ